MLETSIALNPIEEAFRIVGSLSLNGFNGGASIPLFQSMARMMQNNEPLLFILPAFPAKSPSPQKTSGTGPDLGEVLALKALEEMCSKLSQVYAPGAKVLICSDGRVFSDIVMVSDKTIDEYSTGIDDIIQDYQLTHVATLSMDDLYPTIKGDELRQKLMQQFGKGLSEVKELVKSNADYLKLFNGMHRFLKEDQEVLHPEKTRSQITKETKEKTYELIRRSDAWSSLLSYTFKNALRFSIHPYPDGHEKFGIKMIQSSEKWATPWHNVTVKMKGQFELMHLKDALKLNAVKKLFENKYVYFEVQ
jgi:pyoverdine/dityrosine biosynthesis protein Dit1